MSYEGNGRLPVIYVRGFAGNAGGINSAVDDPFYGFNEGSVQVRVDGANRPAFHQFESPLLRLMIDEGYELLVHGDQAAYLRAQETGTVPAATLWVHRFYDEFASILTKDPGTFSIERAATSLLDLVQLVRAKTGAPRVFLVAHSMGGLIVRSLLQRVLPDDPELGGRLDAGTALVDRVFTYASPHGGIEFVGFGLLERIRDLTGIFGADIFGPDRMHEYLTPTRVEGAPPRKDFVGTQLPAGGFPLDRFFCLVGTNAQDYTTALGLSTQAVGTRSDGLVRVENAYLEGAPRSLVHRSHSGRYGIVNSEEGYQNLRRFLFGDLAITANLVNLRLPGNDSDDTAWQLETALSIRGLPVVLHEQSAAHLCPIQIERRGAQDATDTPVPLVTTFLSASATRPTSTMRHVLRLKLISLRERGGLLSFLDHLEQTADWLDTLVVDIGADADGRFATWATWNSTIPGAIRDWDPVGTEPLHDQDDQPGRWRVLVPVPPGARELLGADAAVEIVVAARHTLDLSPL
ncbi:esterase/lipase family protein [Pengzhenrongella sicca]|uniref:Alpha/beta hydrolase n=1 Tax=Pengzhenrongella sicca TaxID=2819238 RepID=A0A8A4ZA50_9MICO|nr:hypothetical protein [Pengzhenrongella sicca]QTE28301.1 hypothetical protein J4E96_13025 [Pengzhenrongella sicca]